MSSGAQHRTSVLQEDLASFTPMALQDGSPGRDAKLVARFEPPGNRLSHHSGTCRSEAGLSPWSEPRPKWAKSQGLERTSRSERVLGNSDSDALSRVAAPA